MNLNALRTFLAIAETGSLVRASEVLNITQSTVTARLKGLEEDLGETLFLRGKSGAHLTAAGATFKRYAEAMTGLWRQAKQATALPSGVEASCNIGCEVDLWPLLGADIAANLRRNNPNTALTVWPIAPSELEDWLAASLIDFALSYRPATREGWTTRQLSEQHLTLYATDPDTPMKFDPGYVFVEGGEAFGRAHHAAYIDAGTAQVSFGAASWALDHLLSVGGSAYLPSDLAAPHQQAGTLHIIPDAPSWVRAAYLITRDDAARNWPWLAELRAVQS
ncbi:MAG: LysR family transcriptional regulator [Pikeienuella sp.]